jgi:hypothetical protein
MVVKEIEPGAVEREAVQEYLLKLKRASNLPVYIINDALDTLIGEFIEVAEAKREFRKQRRKKLKGKK